MDFWRSLGGAVEVELTSADQETMLAILNDNGITLHALQFLDPLTCVFRIKRQDYSKVQTLCQAKSADFRLKQNRGLYWRLKRMLRRPVLLGGLLILFGLVIFLPSRVFFVEVMGNKSVPSKKIIEAAQNCGISFGASRREVRSEKVKNALIAAVPELQWAGINTRGCVATISVRERAMQEDTSGQTGVCSIVAVRDGFVLSATATRGSLLVQPGQTVKSGQLLISGYTDLGLFIQAAAAEGEIFAQTSRELTVVTPTKWVNQTENGAVRKKISLLVGKKRINLWKDSGIFDSTCGRMYKEYYITLPGGFSLPLAVCVDTYRMYDQTGTEMVEPCGDSAMEAYARRYLQECMVAGQIKNVSTERMLTEEVSVLREHYLCQEMIGRVRQEQIGDIHE